MSPEMSVPYNGISKLQPECFVLKYKIDRKTY